VRDLVGSYTRPVKELKDFDRVTLSAGESTSVSFVLNSDKLRFWTRDKEFKAEAGKFNVWIGKNSQEGLQGSFELLPTQAEFECLE
jgi:beta-glucosidase